MRVQNRTFATRYGQLYFAVESLRLDATMNMTGHPWPIGQIVVGPQNPEPTETPYSKFWKAARQFLTPQYNSKKAGNDAPNMAEGEASHHQQERLHETCLIDDDTILLSVKLGAMHIQQQ